MDEAIRAYLAKNGAKGGHAGKGTELRKKLNRAAVQARWAKVKAAASASQAKTGAAVKPKPKGKKIAGADTLPGLAT
jgi:hypothetical protein